MENNIQAVSRCIDENGLKDASQSHAHINRIKKEELRSTKSFELHHTRSFSEIRHLHPSSTDVSFAITCPKPRNIEALQKEVKRPESVLEISDLSVEDGEDDIEEDIADAQEKGDKAMQLFMQSNISVPLDGAMTSSSCSLQSLDSDMASEHELIVGTWKDDGRDSVALSGSSLEKRFLTPSGQLLYREQQVESMLDTKRFKLSPSSSVERPMSPLAVHNTTMKAKNQRCDDDDKNDMETSTNKQDADEHDSSHSNDEESDNEKEKRKKCDCDHYNKLQDLQRVMNEYECQYGELVKREKHFEEIKTLRKDNTNMHKEHNRLQLIVKECYKQEEIVKEKITKTVAEKEKMIQELNVNLKYRNDKINRKNEEITAMRKTIEDQKREISTYDEIFKEISSESKALIQALAKELGEENDQVMCFNAEENGEAILSALKKRRCSLQDDFKNFSKDILHPAWTKGEEIKFKACSQKTDESIDKLHIHLHDNFDEIKSGYKTTLSHVQQTERGVENIQQQTIGLKTMLSTSKNKESKSEKEVDSEWQLQELQEKHNETTNENRVMKEDLTKWTNECDRVTKEHSKLKAEYEELYEEKQQANLKLQDLKTDIRKRLENSYREKTMLEKQLEHLKETYLNTDTKNCGESPQFNSQGDLTLLVQTTSKRKETETSWMKERNELLEKTKVLKNQLVEQGKLIECLVEEGQNANENLKTGKSLAENVMEELPSDTTNTTAVNAAEDRLSQLLYLTDALSDKIEKTSQHVAPLKTDERKRSSLEKEKQNKTLTTLGEHKVLWEIKEIYQEEFDNIQDVITNQQVENRSLKKQLEVKERDEEINKFYIASLKKANEASQEHLEMFKTKHHDLKKELRDVKDRLLVVDAEQRMSRYFNQKKERKTVQEKKTISQISE